MARAKKPKKIFTFESNVEIVSEKVHNAPHRVLQKIGQALIKEIKSTTLRGAYAKQSGDLDRSLKADYDWDKSTGRDLSSLKIGFKKFYAAFVMGTDNDPIKPVIVKNSELIQQMIASAINEINEE